MAKSGVRAPVTVRIGGEDHTIRANVEPEYMKKCAGLVDERISEIKKQLGLIESHKAAILAALSITDELYQAQAEVEKARDASARRAESLLMKLEGVLEDPSVD